jgi:HEAT repeat protein
MISKFVGVFTTDRNLVIQIWDATLTRLTGIHSDDACGRSLLKVIPDLEARGLTRYFRNVLEDGVVEVLAPAFHRYLIPCAPQAPSPRFDRMRQRVIIAPLRQDSHVAGLIVTIEDVTQRLDREHDIAGRLEQQSSSEIPDLMGALDDKNWRVRLEAVREMSQLAAPDAIESLLLSVRDNHRNFGLLNSALNVLRLTDVDTHSTLIEFLKGADQDLRIQAALSLGEQRDVRAIPALLEATRDENVNVVYHSIEALGKLRAVEAVDRLIEFAESKDFFLAFPAIEALGEIGHSGVSFRIIPLLQDEMLREPAARALSRIGDEFAVEALIAILNDRNAPTEPIARSLTDLHDRYEAMYQEGSYIVGIYRSSIKPTGVQNLIDALETAEPESLRSLVWLLGRLDSPAASRALTWRLGSAEMRSEILDALVHHGSTVTELLVEQLKADDPETRGAAVTALGRIRDKRAIPELTRLLGTDPELTIPIIAALTFIRDPSAMDPLFSLLGTPDAAVRRAAISALNALGVPEMVNRVIPLLEDSNPGIREAAVCIAGYFGYPECIETVFSLCHDTDANVRRSAIEQIAYLEDKRAVTVLANALSGDVPAVRAAAAAAMSHVEASSVVMRLIAALTDGDPWVRYFTVRSLARHRSPESATELYQLAQFDKFPQVRIAAFEALCQIDGGLAASIASSFRASGDPDLQQAAASAQLPGYGVS